MSLDMHAGMFVSHVAKQWLKHVYQQNSDMCGTAVVVYMSPHNDSDICTSRTLTCVTFVVLPPFSSLTRCQTNSDMCELRSSVQTTFVTRQILTMQQLWLQVEEDEGILGLWLILWKSLPQKSSFFLGLWCVQLVQLSWRWSALHTAELPEVLDWPVSSLFWWCSCRWTIGWAGRGHM